MHLTPRWLFHHWSGAADVSAVNFQGRPSARLIALLVEHFELKTGRRPAALYCQDAGWVPARVCKTFGLTVRPLAAGHLCVLIENGNWPGMRWALAVSEAGCVAGVY